MVDASEQTQNSETPSDLNSSTHAMVSRDALHTAVNN